MKWVTREHAKVDRIACPWLIRKFVDPEAIFLYVPKDRVLEVARETGAIPFDARGAELDHYNVDGQEFVSFDAIIRQYRVSEPALDELAKIVRAADGGSSPSPEGAGLAAAAEGFRLLATDDFENQRLQFPLYDALYAWCQKKVRTAPLPAAPATP